MVKDEYSEKCDYIRNGLQELHKETALLEDKLKVMRKELEDEDEARMQAEWGTSEWRVVAKKTFPAKDPNVEDWRKEKREEILTVINLMCHTLGIS